MFSFVKNLLGVKADKVADDVMGMLVRWNPKDATEAEKRMISEKLSEFCLKCEEARTKLAKEEQDVVDVKDEARRKMVLLEKWEEELTNPVTTQERISTLEQRMPELKRDLAAMAQRIDREIREAEMARKTFETYDQIVKQTQDKLRQKNERAGDAAAELELLNAEEAMVKEQVSAAKVLAGLSTATDTMDAATSAMQQEAQKKRDKIAAMRREAGAISETVDTFVEDELEKMAVPEESFEAQMAKLKGRL